MVGFVIHLLVTDSGSRAKIVNLASALGCHVEPYESLAEYKEAAPSRGLVLVHDKDEVVDDLFRHFAFQPLPAICFAAEIKLPRVVKALRLGALNYLQYPFSSRELSEAVADGIEQLTFKHAKVVRLAEARKKLGALSPREREVLQGVASGLSSKQIGADLDISPRTVEIHRANMLSQLEVRSSADAVRVAVEAGLTG